MRFHQTHPDRLEPEALIHLNNAIVKGHSNFTLNEVLDNARNSRGTIITIEDKKIMGAMYLERYPMTLNIVLLGGEHIKAWKSELVEYLRSVLKDEGLTHVCLIGRSGWQGIFSELTHVGTLYVGN